MTAIFFIFSMIIGVFEVQGFSFNYTENLSVARTRRQAQGSFICVPPGTCITCVSCNIPSPGPGGIDPRNIVPVGTNSQQPTESCPAGQVACYPATITPQCGQRYITDIKTDPGPSTYGAFPWQAYIKNQTMFTGSGVLLDSTTVLTVAHKVFTNVNTPSNIEVYMGVHDPSTTLATAQKRTACQIFLNPGFNYRMNPQDLKNDLAIIKLSSPIALGYQSNVGTACLPPAGANYVGCTCTVSGWGQTGFGKFDAPTSPQKQVNVPIVNYETCRASYANIISNVDYYLDPAGELCAGGTADMDSCQQDGGAPLVCQDASTGRWNVAGLVNWGKGCGRAGVYGVYVDVSKYLTWINQLLTPAIG